MSISKFDAVHFLSVSLLLALVTCCLPGFSEDKVKSPGWRSYMYDAEKDLLSDPHISGDAQRWKRDAAAYAQKTKKAAAAHKLYLLNPKAVERARLNILKAAAEAKRSIPALSGVKDKRIHDDLCRLNADLSLWVAEQFNISQSQRKHPNDGKELLPFLRQCAQTTQALLDVDEKCLGKTNPELSAMQKSLRDTRHNIAVKEGRH